MAIQTTIEVLRIPGTLFPRGAFDENASYKFLNIVESGGSGYVCLQPCTGIPVTNTAYWFKFCFKGDKGDAFTYADLTAEQKAELVRDATAAAQAAASSAQSAADDAAAALQKFNTIKAAIDAIDPQSTEGSIQTLAAKQGLLEADLNALGPKIDGIEKTLGRDRTIDASRATEGYYINWGTHQKTQTSGMSMLHIEVSSNDVVNISCKASNAVAVVSVYDSDNDSYDCKVVGTGWQNVDDYTYTATEDEELVICWLSSYEPTIKVVSTNKIKWLSEKAVSTDKSIERLDNDVWVYSIYNKTFNNTSLNDDQSANVILIRVKPQSSVVVEYSSANLAVYAILKDYPTGISKTGSVDISAHLVIGGAKIVKTDSTPIVIPSDGNYIIFQGMPAAGSTDRTPASIYIDGYNILESAKQNILKLTADKASKQYVDENVASVNESVNEISNDLAEGKISKKEYYDFFDNTSSGFTDGQYGISSSTGDIQASSYSKGVSDFIRVYSNDILVFNRVNTSAPTFYIYKKNGSTYSYVRYVTISSVDDEKYEKDGAYYINVEISLSDYLLEPDSEYYIRYTDWSSASVRISVTAIGDNHTLHNEYINIPTDGKYPIADSIDFAIPFLSNGGARGYNIIRVGKDYQNKTLFEAISSISSLVSEINRYEIQLYDDEVYTSPSSLHEVDTTIYTNSTIAENDAPYKNIATIPPYVRVVGMGEAKRLWLLLNEDSQREFECLRMDGGELVNLDIRGQGIRYPIHFERRGQNVNTIAILRNCVLEHIGTSGNNTAWGSGLASGVELTFENCTFIARRYPWYMHDGGNGIVETAKFTNCHFLNYSEDRAIVADNWSMPFEIELNGCELNGSVALRNGIESTDVATYLYGWKVSGCGCSPHYFQNECNAYTYTSLAFFTNAIGIGSGIKVISYSSELSNLFANAILYGDHKGHKSSIRFRYKITKAATSGTKSLAGMLGDCSSSNKSIVLSIGGTNKTITFNADYRSMTNEQVIESVNAGIDFGNFILMHPCEDYYEELTDVLHYGYSVNPIIKGLLVKSNGKTISKATGNGVCGLLIDTLYEAGVARYISKNIVSKNDQFAPQFEEGSDTFESGTKFICSSNGKLLIDNNSVSPIAIAIDNTKIQLMF